MAITNFTKEITDKDNIQTTRNQNLKVMGKYFHRVSGSQWCVRKGSDSQISPRFPSFEELKNVYAQIVHRLNLKYKETLVRPPMELDWFKIITRNRKINFRRTIWIGNHSVDIFTASLSFRHEEGKNVTHGIAFEIDGPSHNSEPKIKKDSYIDESLNRLNIGLYRVDTKHKLSADHILKQTRITDSRERRRIWAKIYLETILSHGTPTEIENLFNVSVLELSGGN